MDIKKLLTVLALFAVLPCFAGGVGYINYEKVVQNYQFAKNSLREIETKSNEIQQYLMMKEKEFNQIESAVQKKKFEETVRAELQTVYEQSLNVHAKEQLVCPNCGSSVNINSIYCDKCGTPVYRLNDHRVVKRKICPHCGRPNLPTSPYCSYCFASLADSVSEDFQLIHESKQVGNAVVQQAYLQSQEGKSKICNNCGTLNKPDEDFCVNCGLKLVMEPIKLYCPNCGMENQPDSLFCTRCQWSFEGQSPDSVGDLWTCGQCNRLNDKDSQFCFHCGAKREQNGGTK